MADRMRANLDAVEDGHYDAVPGSEQAACRMTSGCSTADMAADDLFLWRESIGALPGGEGAVCVDSTPYDGTGAAAPACDGSGDQYVVKVWWDNPRDRGVGTCPWGSPKACLAMVFVP
jgi:type IV pilus assembly protein PilV